MKGIKLLAILGFSLISNFCLDAQVELRETANEFSLSNQKVGLTIDKNLARIVGLRFRGQDIK